MQICPNGAWLPSTEAIALAREDRPSETIDRIVQSTTNRLDFGRFHQTMRRIADSFALLG